jgi:hypothetical protein
LFEGSLFEAFLFEAFSYEVKSPESLNPELPTKPRKPLQLGANRRTQADFRALEKQQLKNYNLRTPAGPVRTLFILSQRREEITKNALLLCVTGARR